MIESHGNTKSPAAGPDEIDDPGIGIEDKPGEDAAGREAMVRQLRQDIARLREDIAAIAQSRVDKGMGLVRRNPWPAIGAAVCVGICLGRRM